MKYFQSVKVIGNKIYHRYIEDGVARSEWVDFSPTIYVGTDKPTGVKTLKGLNVKPIQFESIKDYRDHNKTYNDVDGYELHGQVDIESQFMSEYYPEEITWDYSKIYVLSLDIETSSENGFPDPLKADAEITAITVHSSITDKYYVFICRDGYTPKDGELVVKGVDERDMLRKFVQFFKARYPDVITGWNIDGFDIPFIINRINRLHDEEITKDLSPIRKINVRESKSQYGTTYTYEIVGIECLDYLELYKKYNPKNQESYTLDFIAGQELGEQKLDYSEYDNLHEFYLQNFQKYVEYNVHDVRLIVRLEKKLKMIMLQIMVAYLAKENYKTAFSPVLTWTNIIYHHLLKQNVVFDHKHHVEAADFAGGFVKEPQVGLHPWVITLDAASLYPSLILACNISPETKVEYDDLPHEIKHYYMLNIVEKIAAWEVPEDLQSMLKKYDYTIAANGQIYRKDIQGVIPFLISDTIAKRKVYKKKMLDLKKASGDPDEISYYSVYEQALKILANSLYGALGNKYFTLYDLVNAEAVTLTGQAAARGVCKQISNYINKMAGTDLDNVLYQDTDSGFFQFQHLMSTVKGKTQDEMVDILTKFADGPLSKQASVICDDLSDQLNTYAKSLVFKREKVITRMALLAKKRYICMVADSEGVKYEKPEFTATGVETNRSSTPGFVREKLKEAFQVILTEDEDSIISFVEAFKEKFISSSYETIAFPRSANDLEKYSNKTTIYGPKCPIAVRAALLYNYQLDKHKLGKKYPKIKSGEKIKYVHMLPNPTQENVIGFTSVIPTELNLEKYIDYDTMFDKSFLDPVRSVMTTIGWELEKQSSLESFF